MSFTTLDPTDFVVSSDSVTAPAWSGNNPTLITIYQASPTVTTGISSDAFYLNAYNADPASDSSATIQFSIAYGDSLGSGSKWYNSNVPYVSPSLTTYKQYKTLIYGPAVTGSQGFNFGGLGSNAQTIWVLNIDRNRYKESLFPGTFNLRLTSGSTTLSLTDNSNDTSVISYLDCGRVFSIVSGSNGKAVSTTPTNGIANGQTASGSYGLFLPDIGVIVLNASALALSPAYGGMGAVIDRSSNPSLLYTSTNNNRMFNYINDAGSFQLNSQETISSNYAFIRIKNSEYNYTSNPTYISGSGNLVYSSLINSPQTYVTTVGLYNQNSELLAVGKLSRPLVKDFTKEALIRVKLDW